VSTPVAGPIGASLIIDSATGVDVRLRIAGPGARCFAFTLDWHIRLVLAVAWYVTAAVLYNRALRLTPPATANATWFGVVLAPATAIYFLYHYVLEVAMRGRTPGKRTAGIRIATRSGGTPSIGQLLTRNVFRLIDSLPACYGIGLIMTLATRNHVRIGDLAAGTLLIYEPARIQELAALPEPATAQLSVAHAEVLQELLTRWAELEPAARERLARRLLEACGLAAASEPSLHAQLERLRAGGGQ
jgi:uncharacterized RDD family membrane protein YckC